MDMTDGQRLEFEVVAILKDEESGDEFAVLHGVTDDQFAVTDANGKLLDDTELAQEVLDDFFVLAEESTKEEG
jgi:hypothetical protein